MSPPRITKRTLALHVKNNYAPCGVIRHGSALATQTVMQERRGWVSRHTGYYRSVEELQMDAG
eukprot:9323300-Pyramimonas_sp.AAC.1